MALFTDTFDGAADATVADRAGWSNGASTTNYARLNGSGGVKSINTTAPTAAGACQHDTGGANHFCQVTLGSAFAAGGFSADLLFVRGSSSGYSHYAVTYAVSTTTLRIRLFANNAFTILNSTVFTIAAGDVLRLEASGDTLRLLVNGVERLTATDSTLAGNTQVGFRARTTAVQDPFILDFTANLMSSGPAPVLSAPTASATSSLTASGTVTTNTATGVLRYMASTNATETEATLFSAGAEVQVSSTGAYTVSLGGLTPSTTYRMHFCQEDEFGVRSNVVTSAQFTTPAADTIPPSLTGAITVASKTSSTISVTCPTGTDNVGVVAYDWSRDGGTSWPDSTQTPQHTFTGLTPLTTYALRVRARDGSDNVSAALALSTATYRAGAMGSTILLTTGPVDGNPAGILYNDVQPGDDAKWFSFVITEQPATGTLLIDPDGTFTFTGSAPAQMRYQLEVDGANVGSPALVMLYSSGLYRPIADVTTTGWATTAGTRVGAINEISANDTSYVTSPVLSGTPGGLTVTVPEMPAGSYMTRMRARRTGATGEARVVYLTSADVQVGATSWQALTDNWATYALNVTLTGTAARARIEVRG